MSQVSSIPPGVGRTLSSLYKTHFNFLFKSPCVSKIYFCLTFGVKGKEPLGKAGLLIGKFRVVNVLILVLLTLYLQRGNTVISQKTTWTMHHFDMGKILVT